MELNELNNFINTQYCHDTEVELCDEKIIADCISSQHASVNSLTQSLHEILKEHCAGIETTKLHHALLCKFIPPGLKSVVRGLKFNNLVGKKLKDILVHHTFMRLELETKCDGLYERPDWILTNTVNGRKLVGYNQIDLWSGGHQINRASKYVIDDLLHTELNTKDVFVVSVVCNHVIIKTKKSKMYETFCRGIQHNRLVYINGIDDVVNTILL
jgi:hypothetical protein